MGIHKKQFGKTRKHREDGTPKEIGSIWIQNEDGGVQIINDPKKAAEYLKERIKKEETKDREIEAMKKTIKRSEEMGCSGVYRFQSQKCYNCRYSIECRAASSFRAY